jgi:hypothetical protein
MYTLNQSCDINGEIWIIYLISGMCWEKERHCRENELGNEWTEVEEKEGLGRWWIVERQVVLEDLRDQRPNYHREWQSWWLLNIQEMRTLVANYHGEWQVMKMENYFAQAIGTFILTLNFQCFQVWILLPPAKPPQKPPSWSLISTAFPCPFNSIHDEIMRADPTHKMVYRFHFYLQTSSTFLTSLLSWRFFIIAVTFGSFFFIVIKKGALISFLDFYHSLDFYLWTRISLRLVAIAERLWFVGISFQICLILLNVHTSLRYWHSIRCLFLKFELMFERDKFG